MPRKKAEPQAAPLVEPSIASDAYIPQTDAQLMERYFALKDWITGEDKRFEEYMAPHKAEIKNIKQEFLKRLNERAPGDGDANSKTDYGTAYRQQHLNVSISPEGTPYLVENNTEPLVGRDAFLEFCLDHWAEIGSDALMVSAQKDAVRKWMEDHEGQPPPGVKTSTFADVNIRRS